MDHAEAREIITSEMTKHRALDDEQLCALIGRDEGSFEVSGPSGAYYQVEVLVFWDWEPQANVRVMCVSMTVAGAPGRRCANRSSRPAIDRSWGRVRDRCGGSVFLLH